MIRGWWEWSSRGFGLLQRSVYDVQRWHRALPEPTYFDPETLQNDAMNDRLFSHVHKAIKSILSPAVEFSLLSLRIDEPVLANTALLIFEKLVPTIDSTGAAADDLDHQISRTIQVQPF